MAQTQAIVDKLLTNVSSAIVPEGYISESLFPGIKVKQTTGLLGKYGQQHLKITNTVMSGEGKARRVKPIVRDTDSYNIDDHGIEGVITKRDRDNVERPFEAERDEVMGLTNIMWADKEQGLATVLADPAVLTQNVTLAGAGQLNAYNTSDPIGVFQDARIAVRNGSSLPPNTAFMDWEVAQQLRFHPALLESLGFTQKRPGGLSMEELAKAMLVDKLLIAKAMFDPAREGQTDSLQAIWGKHIWFAMLPKVSSTYQVSLGYHLTVRGEKPRQVFKSPINNPPKATSIILTDNYQFFLTNVLAGYLIEDAIA